MSKVKISDFIYWILLGIMVTMLLIMVTTVSINVVTRYFGRGILWVEEISNLAFVWMSFIAIALGWQYNIHPGFELFKNKGLASKLMELMGLLLILIFLGFVLKGGWDYTTRIANQKTPILGISVAWKYAAVPFSVLFMVVETIRKITLLVKKETVGKRVISKGGDL